MKLRRILFVSLASVLLLNACTSSTDTLLTVPVEFDISFQVNPVSPEFKSTQGVQWGSTMYNPQMDDDMAAYAGRVLSLRATQVIFSVENLSQTTPISEARIKFGMPNPTAGPGDPIANRWITSGWYTQNAMLENHVNYSWLPAQDTANWNTLSRMLFTSDTVNVQWEGWHDLVESPYTLNVKIMALLETSGR